MTARKPKPSAALQLVAHAQTKYEFGMTIEGRAFARRIGGHIVHLLSERGAFRSTLASEFLALKGAVASGTALSDALKTLEGIARCSDPVEVHLRVADHEGTVYLDLGGSDNRVVRIDLLGWAVLDSAPVLFRRTGLTGVMPEPLPGGNLGALWDVINVAEDDRPLVLAWLICALVCPSSPCPILTLRGEQGSGKSSASRPLLDLADPSPAALRSPPKDVERWPAMAAQSRAIGIDNASHFPADISDALCRAVTGDALAVRQLYSDDEPVVFRFRKVLLINGIDLGALRPDLADRMVPVELRRLDSDKRLSEKTLLATWEASYPRVLGSLLDLAVEVLRILPSVAPLTDPPRMVDYAEVLACIDKIMGTSGLDNYVDKLGTMQADGLDSSPFLARMRAELTSDFFGTAAELHARVGKPFYPAPREWPSPRTVTTLLHRHAPALRAEGWHVESHEVTRKGGALRWNLRPPGGSTSTTDDGSDLL